MTISSPGIGSGIDIKNLVPDLVAAERAPTENRLNSKEADLRTELSAVSLIKGALSSFQESLGGLQDATTFSSRSAESSDESIAGFSAENTAAAGSYSLEVTSLASAQKLVTQQDYVISEGTLEFTDADGSFSVTLNSDNNATIQDVQAAINNASDNIGISATILVVNGSERLVFTTDETGADNALTITGTSTSGDLDIYDYNSGTATPNATDPNIGDVTGYYDQVIAAADAVFSVDGQSMTSSTNNIEGVIPNATITLKDSNPGEPITLSISENSSSIKTQIQKLVAGYNSLISQVNAQTNYNADTEIAGSLFGDSLVNNLKAQIRNTLTGQITNSSSDYTSLASIGITTNRDGSFELDSDRLDAALEADYDGITTLFSDTDQGIATKVDNILENYLASNGSFDSRTDTINNQLEDIADDRTKLDYRMELVEARLFKQYNAMDLLVANLNATGDWLTSAFENLPGVVRKD